MIKAIANFLSYVFHPLLIMTYGLLFMMQVNPYQFGGTNNMMIYLIQVVVISFILPIFSVVLMRMLGLIESLHMEDREERIIPYVSTLIFYFWLALIIYKTSIFPRSFEIFAIGATLALLFAFFLNLFSKISIHAVGMGGLVAMVIINMLYYSYDDLKNMLLVVLILAGMVGTSRLILNAHEPKDIYGGYLVGFTAQFIVLMFLF